MEHLVQNFKIKYKKTPITVSLIVLCVAVYVLSFFLFGEEMNTQQAIDFGGYNPLYVYTKYEYYRLFTANFIHFGIIHIAVNCYSLYGIGTFIETVLKEKKYLIVLVVSALTTTGLPYILFLINGFEAYTISGGISGVIFGLIGALGALALKYKDIFMDVFRQLAPNVLLMLLISFVIPTISLSGHISGLIGGFVASYLLLSLKSKRQKTDSDLLN